MLKKHVPTLSMLLAADYVAQKQNFVDTVLCSLENHDVHLFVRMRASAVKEKAISCVENMWQRASEQTETTIAQTRAAIENALREIERTETEMKSTRNIFKKVACWWRLFFQYRSCVLLEDFIALHIAEKGNNFNEHEELLIRMRQRIVTLDDLNFLFDAWRMHTDAPQACPTFIKQLTVEDVPYLNNFCREAKRRRYTSADLLAAWRKMLDMKFRNVDCSNWEGMLPPEQALFLLFEHMSYAEITKHTCVFVELINEGN